MRANARAQIEQALLTLLRDRALDDVNVQDLVVVNNNSRQLFYYYFKNKHDLVCWMLAKDVALSTETFRAGGLLQDYIGAFLRQVQERSTFYRAVAASQHEEDRRAYTDYFENGLINCAQISENYSSQGRMSAQQWDALHFFTYGASRTMENWLKCGMHQGTEQVTELICCNLQPALERYFTAARDNLRRENS